jgi:hypothetical protein
LIDGEDQGDRFERGHQLAEALDEPLRGVAVGPRDDPAEQGAVGGREVLAAEVLEDAPLDPGVVALEEDQSADQVEVERVEPVVHHDLVGKGIDQPGQAAVVELAGADRVEPVGRDERRALGDGRRQPEQARRLAGRLVIRLVERVDQVVEHIPAIMVGGRRHLEISEIAPAAGMRPVAEGAQEVGLAAPRLPLEQQDAPGRLALPGRPVDQALERRAGFLVDRRDVERVFLPDVVAVRDRVEDVRPFGRAEGGDPRVVGLGLGRDDQVHRGASCAARRAGLGCGHGYDSPRIDQGPVRSGQVRPARNGSGRRGRSPPTP